MWFVAWEIKISFAAAVGVVVVATWETTVAVVVKLMLHEGLFTNDTPLAAWSEGGDCLLPLGP